MSTMNYYVVLGIAEDADSDTIRSSVSSVGTALPSRRRRRLVDRSIPRSARRVRDTERPPHVDGSTTGTSRLASVRPTIIAEPIGSRRWPNFSLGRELFPLALVSRTVGDGH
jgi:hypothetical protein